MVTYRWGSRVIFRPIADNIFELTLIFMHIDGIERMHLALYEVSPWKTNGILLAKMYCIF